MKKQFKVIDFNKDQFTNILTVDLDCNRCHIPLDKFEKWLGSTDKLNWVHDWSDHDGEHCQESGRYNISQYWDMSQKQIQHDIYDFIDIHFVSNNFVNQFTKTTSEYAR